jgi:hypothetical protein
MSDLPTKPKKVIIRKKAGSTPIPNGPGSMGPTCGHEGKCTANACHVTYAGPVSRLQDHHMITASRGTTHIWPAAVITSLALLVTGSVAFYSVDASQSERTSALQEQTANRADIAKLEEQLNRIERMTSDILKTVKPEPTAKEMMKKVSAPVEEVVVEEAAQ